MTGGGEAAEINFGGAREVYLCEFKRDTGAQEIYSSVDQTNKVKTKKKVFSSKFPQILVIVSKFLRFSTNSNLKTKKKVFVSKVLCRLNRSEFTKITKIRAVDTNLGVLGLDLHSSSPELFNFFGAQSSLGGAQFFGGGTSSHLGARSRNAPRGAGPAAPSLWLRYWLPAIWQKIEKTYDMNYV